MVQQLLFAIADQRKVEPDNMVLNETQEEHFDYHREDFRGGRGAHTESDKQESVGAKFTDWTMFSKCQGWVSESWINSSWVSEFWTNSSYFETKYSKVMEWVSGTRSWALGKYLDFYPVFHSIL